MSDIEESTDQPLANESSGNPGPGEPELADAAGEAAPGDSLAPESQVPLPLETTEGRALRLEEQLEEAQDRYLRLAAEYDNFRKRVARERVAMTDRAQADLLAKLLDVLDDLERLVAIDLESTNPLTLHEGMVLVDRKFRKELELAGLERLAPDGEPFDPNQHEAVAMVPTEDADVDHHVAQTFQVGYRYKGTLVRPARVQVYTASGQA